MPVAERYEDRVIVDLTGPDLVRRRRRHVDEDIGEGGGRLCFQGEGTGLGFEPDHVITEDIVLVLVGECDEDVPVYGV